LSIADFSYLKPLVMGVSETLKEKNVSLSLPSQRADRFNVEVAEAVQSVRKSTLTFAPEAGTERLRNVINKNLTDAEIMNAVTTAYQSGWNKVKLYFILGLPTETNEDLDGIVDIVRRMKQTCLEMKRDKSLSLKGHLDVNVTLSNFVPKPHTPFQWFPQDSMDTLAQKIQYLRDAFRGMKGVKLNFTDPQISKLEAVISKGGPELADALEGAYRKGAYLDAWDDILNFDKWFAAMDELGMDPEEYTRCRFTNPDEPVPWDVVDMGLSKEWLKTEYERAREAMGTTPCFEECSACGVCGTYSTWPKFIENPYMEEEKTAASVPAVKDAVDAIKPVADLKKPPVCKVRVAIQKKKSVKFLSHLDWLRMFQRALTRSGLPVAYTQGFNPKHKISFGPALSLGVESDGEYIDVFLSSHVTGIADQVNVYLPENGKIISEAVLPLSEPKIDKSIRQMTYTARWTCKDPAKAYMMEERIQQMRSQSDIPMDIETKTSKKSFNLSQYLSDIQFEKDKNDIIVHMTLDVGFTDEGQPIIIKPQWVLDVIEKDTHSASALEWSICRTQIMLKETQKQLVTA
ncbi:MAG: TIGR03936 family radical SAM-associated protein, partial [Vampirovibrio sp.]|nr:TIGR03936 family radical SAM-associated protein [Vampirovibrio sp.]